MLLHKFLFLIYFLKHLRCDFCEDTCLAEKFRYPEIYIIRIGW